MRRTLAAVAALSGALLAAGCSGPEKGAASQTVPAAGPAVAASADPAVAASADAALSGNTKAICAQADRTSTSFGATFAADYQLLITAAFKNAAARARAQEKAAQDVDSFSFALLDMSKLASDPALKKALGTMGAQVTALKGDLSRIDDEKLADLHATLDQACGKS